ncbi:primase-helicase family protein [Tardiphaga sp.]|uniref:primase-helicase family protein n=1 Tax=Tardiphaga sp. TaxID=1926292 RepID=UPI002629556C|nr:primase-helicase family protein [Tardiphaga sp.]
MQTTHQLKENAKLIADLVENIISPEIAEINEKHALAMWGSKAVIIIDDPKRPIQIRSLDAHKAWFCNRKTQITDAAGNTKLVPLGAAWISHPQRRQYEGIEFFPNPDGHPSRPNYFNLWRGFSVAPSSVGSYHVFKDHLLKNICNGDTKLYAYVFGWFAQIVQQPRQKAGTALVLRGRMGTGKSKLGEVFGSLINDHYIQVDDARYVTGQFNVHMSDKLLMQPDEAVWAGDKSAEGRLKGLITSEYQMIEAKGGEPIRMPNYMRIVMTSNEGWVVPAGVDERRFCVLDVHPRCAENHEYFAEMQDQLDSGGRERLLHDLLSFDLKTVNFRSIPKTKALLDQKIRSLDSVDSYWYGRLCEGLTTTDGDGWHRQIPTAVLFDDYVKSSMQIGERRRQSNSHFGERILRLGAEKRRPSARSECGAVARPYQYSFPSLSDARDLFEEVLGQPIDWLTTEDADAGDEMPH